MICVRASLTCSAYVIGDFAKVCHENVCGQPLNRMILGGVVGCKSSKAFMTAC